MKHKDRSLTDDIRPPEESGRLFTGVDRFSFFSTFLVTFVVYFFTLPPTVSLEDAGELAVAADYLGVPHPPGYPIWSLLAWFFQWIFHGVTYHGHPNPAWSIALMSGFFGALTCGCIALLITKSSTHMLDALRKPRQNFRTHYIAPVVGVILILILCSMFRVAGAKTGYFLLGLLLIYITVSFALGYFHQRAIKFFLAPGQLGPFIYGGLVGLFIFISLWTRNMPAMVISLSLVVLIPLTDLLMDKVASRSREMPEFSEHFLRWAAGFSGGLLLAFSHVMWSQSVIIEVYSLNAFFAAAIFLFTYCWMCRPHDNRLLYLVAFLFGLGLTNHQSLLFLMLFLLAALASRQRLLFKDSIALIFLVSGVLAFFKARQYGAAIDGTIEDLNAKTFFTTMGFLLIAIPIVLFFLKGYLFTQWKRLVIMFVLVVLGLSFHGYMPISSEQNPPMNWAYPRTSQGFKHALFRGQYDKISVKENAVKIKEQLEKDNFFFFKQLGAFFYDPNSVFSMVRHFSSGLSLLGLLPFLLFYRFDVYNRTWLAATAIALFSLTVLFLIAQYPQLDYQDLFIKRVQYIQAHALFATWVGYGLVIAIYVLYKLIPALDMAKIMGLVIAFMVPLVPLLKNAKDPDQVRILGSCEMNKHDFGWQFGYYQLVGAEGIKEDLAPGESLPNPDYPPPMEKGAIFFGGTDPGRFVPTYMIFSAKVRPDILLITQNALADNTYMNITRDMYGDLAWIPSLADSNKAFREYVDNVEAGRTSAGAEVNTEGGRVSVQGVGGVMKINAILCKQMWEHNKDKHAFYVEESYAITWMYHYMTPHGLVMKLHDKPVGRFSAEVVKNDMDFWKWYTERLLNNPQFKRDIIAQKTFSKLRSSLAGLYAAKGMVKQSETAFLEAIALYPMSPEANFRLGEVYRRHSRYKDARKIINDLLMLDPSNLKAHQFLDGISRFEALNERRLAMEKQVSAGKALDIKTAVNLMSIYHSMQMIPQLDNLARSILKVKEFPPNVYLEVSQLLMKMKRIAIAEEAIQIYIQRKPNDYKGWVELAAINMTKLKYPEALGAIQKATEVGKETAQKSIRQDARFKALAKQPSFQKFVPPVKPQFNFSGQGGLKTR